MEINGVEARQFVVIKSWHTVLTLIGWLVMTVLQFAYVYAQTAQNSKDIEQIRQGYVPKDRFDQWKEDVLRRLQRIEDKLDQDRSLREPH